jgi:hypothetical protein
MAEIAFGFAFGGGFSVHGMISGEGVGRVAGKTGGVILPATLVVPVPGHAGGGALRCKEEKYEYPAANGKEQGGLEPFTHHSKYHILDSGFKIP